jgi:radical SAM protein with 4Fe4S-binding SPASM domain
MLNMESLLAGIDECDEWNIKPSLNSNLTLGTTDRLADIRSAGVDSVLTSLSSSNPDTHDFLVGRAGAFEDTVNGIERAKLAGLRVTVNMVICKDNLGDVFETGNFCRQELGVRSFAATRVGPSSFNINWFRQHGLEVGELEIMLGDLVRLRDEGMEVDMLEPLPLCALGEFAQYESFINRRCVAGIATCAVGVDGDVRPCSHLGISYGNIFKTDFSEIWRGMEAWRNGSLIPERCRSCDYVARCGGGCRVAGLFNPCGEGNSNQEDIYTRTPSVIANMEIGEFAKSKKIPDGFSGMVLRISDEAKAREEDFGGVVSVNGVRARLITPSSFKLLEELEQRSDFTLLNLSSEFDCSVRQLTDFLGVLYLDKVVVGADENN